MGVRRAAQLSGAMTSPRDESLDDAEVHIAALEAAGLIDAALAARLRAAATGAMGSAGEPALPSWEPVGTVGAFFGPVVTITELFAYLGAAFLFGGWLAFIGNLSETSHPTEIIAGGLALSALAMFGLGAVLARGDRRRRRGAGVVFLATTFLTAGSAAYVVQMDFLRNTFQDQAPGILIAAVAVVVAAFLRRWLPSVMTQFGLVVSLAGLAGAILSWLRSLVYQPEVGGGVVLNPVPVPPEPVGLLVAAAIGWLLAALGLGLLGTFEARRATADPAAGRRAAITRFLAGLVAIVGTATSLTPSGPLGGDAYGRLIEPWIADLAIALVAAVLLERAFRRDSTAFILPGAFGLIIALTDLNFSYLAQSVYIGLLIEGGILLGVGFLASRVRRRLNRFDADPGLAKTGIPTPPPAG